LLIVCFHVFIPQIIDRNLEIYTTVSFMTIYTNALECIKIFINVEHKNFNTDTWRL